MSKLELKKILPYIIIYIVLILIILFVDYYNIFGFITIKLNCDCLNIVITTLTTILLFCIVYNLVDSKIIENENKRIIIEQEKNDNKKMILLLLFQESYEECLNNINLVSDEKKLKDYIIPKIDFDSVNDKIMKNLCTLPFASIDNNMTTFIDGSIPYNFFENFLVIKKLYNQYVNLKIVFFDAKEKGYLDIVEYQNSLKNELCEKIKIEKELINKQCEKR